MTYADRVRELEAEGLGTSDAQAVASAEQTKGRVFDFDPEHPLDDAPGDVHHLPLDPATNWPFR